MSRTIPEVQFSGERNGVHQEAPTEEWKHEGVGLLHKLFHLTVFQLTEAPNKQRRGGDRRQLCPLQRAAGTPELALLRAPRGRGTPTPQPR